ncbi:DNA methyltransferase [Candidatus Borrarchaeum sp.]|uniref:DNA methyltransferase n=1 Tax=Candidatus Borrarchaeum sp. TaxID=2846742 RepID=UPI00257A1C73|nr:DNA methyltransferase [Candidatus Borrarchaeum sp.]
MTLDRQTMFGKKTPCEGYLDLINRKYGRSESLEILDKIEWDFKDFTTQYLTHKFHSYPARFIPQIPLTFLKLFSKKKETIADPFCGCGTTLVEAFLNNRHSIGNDFNPLAALITKVKTTLINKEELLYLNERLASIKSKLDVDNSQIDERLRNMPRRKISKLFDRKIISQLEAIRETLLEIRAEGFVDIYDLGQVALSATIWSLVEHGIVDVKDLFLRKVAHMENELKKTAKVMKNIPNVLVLNSDARKLEVESESIDLIVTSPPYVNALDYYRVHMYNMFWLDMDFNAFKKHEIGAHSRFINNRFRLFSEYLGAMLRSMIEMNRILKQNKFCVIVVGNSSLEYELIESHKFFAEMSKDIGFKTIKTIFRTIDKTKKYTSADIGKIDDEFILILQKIENINVTPESDVFIAETVTQQMMQFREKLKHSQGTSIRGRKPTKERLLKNIDKIDDAINKISKDIIWT